MCTQVSPLNTCAARCGHPPPSHFAVVTLSTQRRLSVTLSQAYGDDAWSLMPLSFSLPNEVWSWRTWLSSSQEQGSAVGPWILKTAQHLGKGLKLLPGHAALEESLKARYVQQRS